MLEIVLVGLFGLLLIGPLLMNIVGPFIIWRTQKIPTVVQFEPLSDDTFYEHCSALAQGYDHQCTIRIPIPTCGSIGTMC